MAKKITGRSHVLCATAHVIRHASPIGPVHTGSLPPIEEQVEDTRHQ